MALATAAASTPGAHFRSNISLLSLCRERDLAKLPYSCVKPISSKPDYFSVTARPLLPFRRLGQPLPEASCRTQHDLSRSSSMPQIPEDLSVNKLGVSKMLWMVWTFFNDTVWEMIVKDWMFCFGSWWQLPLVVHGKVCPAKSVITFCCIKKLLPEFTDWNSKIQTLFKLHSLLPLITWYRSLPEPHEHNHRRSGSPHYFQKSLIQCAQSYVTEDATSGWMKTSMWKTILLPCFVPKISQNRSCTTASLKNDRGEAVLWNYPEQSRSESSSPNFYWVVLTNRN